jgi:hypothetical protein
LHFWLLFNLFPSNIATQSFDGQFADSIDQILKIGQVHAIPDCSYQCDQTDNVSNTNVTKIIRALPSIRYEARFFKELTRRNLGQIVYPCPNDQRRSNMFFRRRSGRADKTSTGIEQFLHRRFSENEFAVQGKFFELEAMFRFWRLLARSYGIRRFINMKKKNTFI